MINRAYCCREERMADVNCSLCWVTWATNCCSVPPSASAWRTSRAVWHSLKGKVLCFVTLKVGRKGTGLKRKGPIGRFNCGISRQCLPLRPVAFVPLMATWLLVASPASWLLIQTFCEYLQCHRDRAGHWEWKGDGTQSHPSRSSESSEGSRQFVSRNRRQWHSEQSHSFWWTGREWS